MEENSGTPVINPSNTPENISQARDITNNSESISEPKKTSITKVSDESREFRELNKEIFQIIQQGGNISGASLNNNTNGSVGGVNINDNTWSKKVPETPQTNLINKDEIDNAKLKKPKHTLIPNPKKQLKEDGDEITDDVPNTIEKINTLHIQECKTNNLSELDSYQYVKNSNFIPKASFGLAPTPYPPMIYPPYNDMMGNGANYYYNNMFLFENAFTVNNNISNKPPNNPINNPMNEYNTTNGPQKRKKKFKDKFDQTLFTINLDQIILGRDIRTTIMIRHIPNKYSSQTLLEEIDIACKGKYDFFYLPIDTENNLNLGYSFINFVSPLHIIYFYHLFKARKWNHFKSHKECDLTFAKFQGKVELTAHLEKNMNKLDENKKLPMLFTITTPPKVDMPKEYFDYIKNFRADILNSVNFK